MPNYVYNTISVEDKYADKIEEIAKVGLAQYYRPMPAELHDTTYPVRLGVNMTEEHYDYLLKTYGHADWYSWANANWGTKWGSFDNEIHDCCYTFTTAWSQLDSGIIDMLLEDIPSLIYSWEEEQGFGEEAEYTDGERVAFIEWDLPEWEEVSEGITLLVNTYKNNTDTYESGYYAEYDLQDYLSDTLEDARVKQG